MSEAEDVPRPEGGLKVQKLDWINFFEEDLPSADVIVGSDLVFSVDLLPGLVNLIKKLLLKNQKRNCKAFIACTHRNGPSIEKFLQLLKAADLKYEVFLRRKFSPSDGILTNHEPLKPVSLYLINLS